MIEEITAIVTAIATSLTVILLFFRKEKDFLEKCKKEIKDIKNSSKETRNFFKKKKKRKSKLVLMGSYKLMVLDQEVGFHHQNHRCDI
jgi:mannitol-specific phosphotransferase system IIBC component